MFGEKVQISYCYDPESVLIEIVQPVTGRFFELYDILANSVGLGIAVCAYLGGTFLIKRVQSEKIAS